MTPSETPPFELPEYSGNPFIARLPPLRSEEDAIKILEEPSAHSEVERRYPDHLRVHCIMRLARFFEPLNRHLQLEQRLSLLLRQGYLGRNPLTGSYLHHLRDSHERAVAKDLFAGGNPAPSTAASFALLGCSGMGKTRTVEQILHSYPQVIRHSEPFTFDQLVWLKLDSPHLGSPKQLCISFFQALDHLLGTPYHREYRRRALDELMIDMARVANIHALGMLVVDEIQHLNRARGSGKEDLLNFLVTLVNTIGIPVVVIGTLGAVPLLQGDFRQARRASGLGSMVWERLERKDGWDHFVRRMWRCQWTQEQTLLTDEILDCLYEESQGIIDIVIKLYMLTQMQAIQLRHARSRPEKIDVKLLQHVARENFKLLSPMIGALKRGDREAIAKYDDIRPFHDHMEQLFQAAMHSSLAAKKHLPASAPVASTPDAPRGEATGQVGQMLNRLGVAADVAEVVLVAAVNAVGEEDQVALMTAALDQLKAGPAGPKGRTPRKRPETRQTAVPDDSDLRSIVTQKAAAGMSAYEALLAAGLIHSVIEDFPIR